MNNDYSQEPRDYPEGKMILDDFLKPRKDCFEETYSKRGVNVLIDIIMEKIEKLEEIIDYPEGKMVIYADALNSQLNAELCKVKKEIEELKMQIKALEFKNDVEEASKHIIDNDWNDWDCCPDDDKNILMKYSDYDVPPWTGYHDGENYIAFETRLPVIVSHWKYVE